MLILLGHIDKSRIMKNLFLLLMMGFSAIVVAQNPIQSDVSGPATFCQTGVFTVTINPSTFTITNIFIGGGLPSYSLNIMGQQAEIVFSNLTPGFYSGGIAIWATDATGLMATDSIDLSFEVAGTIPINITSVGAFCLPDSSADPSACVKVCNHALATYAVTDFGNLEELEWLVIGAESYSIEGDFVTVQWGEAGQGLITATKPTEDSVFVAGLQVFSGLNESLNSGTSGFSYFVQIVGGQGPYTILVEDAISPSTGNTISWVVNLAGIHVFELPFNGLYTITITDALGATQSNMLDAAVSDQVNWGVYLLSSNLGLLCAQDSTQSITAIATNSFLGGELTYAWSTGATTATVVDLATGYYSVTVTRMIITPDATYFENVATTFYIECPPPATCPAAGQICVTILEEVKAIISPTPAPDATTGNVILCDGQALALGNQSMGASAFFWDFGDGNISTQFSPAHTYASPGTYVVKLIVYNTCYCTDTTLLTVEVLAAPKPDISCEGTICEGKKATYTTTTACGSYLWIVSAQGVVQNGGGPGDNYVEVLWTNGPVGTISLQMIGCPGIVCNSPNVITIPIISDDTQIYGEQIVCPGSVESYSVPNYQGSSYTWSVTSGGVITSGQGSHQITVQWQDALTSAQQTVSVVFDNCYLDCGGQATLPVDLQTKFFVGGPIVACLGGETQHFCEDLQGVAVISNWSVTDALGVEVWSSAAPVAAVLVPWDFAAGQYVLTATPVVATDYCLDQYRQFIQVKPQPAAPTGIIGPDPICLGVAYTYEATGSALYEVVWEAPSAMDQNLSGNPVNVTWLFAEPYELFAFNVSNDGLGCLSEPFTLTVSPMPADFTLVGDMAICNEKTGTYTAENFQDAKYEWAIIPEKAGTILTGLGTNEITILWHDAGTATVQATICNVVEALQVLVHTLPQPFIPDQSVCQDASLIIDAGVWSSYQWELLGNSIIATTQTVDIAQEGFYQLQISDSNGCYGDTTFTVAYLPDAAASISTSVPYIDCVLATSSTIHASTTQEGYSYQWFQDGVIMSATTPEITVNVSGDYFAVATNVYGCSEPTNSVNVGTCASFGGVCVDGSCLILINGNTPGGSCTPSGNVDFISLSTSNCSAHLYQNTTTNGVPGSYYWYTATSNSFNDNASLNSLYPGYVMVTLIGGVVDAFDPTVVCYDFVQHEDIFPAVANFVSNEVCIGSTTQFTDITEYVSPFTIVSWNWDFGDPGSGASNTSTLQHPTHNYTTSGNHFVQLTVTMSNGCQAISSQNVQVIALPTLTFAPPTITCEDTPLPFNASLAANHIGVSWAFGDPSSSNGNQSGDASTFHTFDMPGNYSVSLTVTDNFGCKNTFSAPVAVTPNTLGGNITAMPPSPICDGDASTLTAPAGGASWSWSTGSVLNNVLVNESGVFTVTITSTDGCVYTPAPYELEVLPLPTGVIQATDFNEYNQPVATFSTSYSACEGENVYLNVLTQTQSASISWSTGGNGSEQSFTDLKGNLLTVGTHVFSATITDLLTGCINQIADFTVTIHGLPVVSISALPVGFLCENTLATISVDAPDATLNYYWNTNETGPSIQTTLGGNYFCRVVNEFGCVATSNTIEIHKAPSIEVVTNGCHIRCQPDTMCIAVAPDVASFQWFLDGAAVPAPEGNLVNPIFTQSGSYQVEMTDVYGCISMSQLLNLDLFLGYGDVFGQVYEDINENGVIDAGDQLLPSIPLVLTNTLGATLNLNTNTTGDFVFSTVASVNYTVGLNLATLPAEWLPVWTDTDVSLSGCDDTVSAVFLLQAQCITSEEDIVFTVCSGSSVDFNGQSLLVGDEATATFLNIDGCDSIVHATVSELPHQVLDLTFNGCQGEPYDYQGTLIIPGDPTVLFTNINTSGCLDSAFVTITANPIDTEYVDLNLCAGSQGFYLGELIEIGQIDTITTTGPNGCDLISIVTGVDGGLIQAAITELPSCANQATGQVFVSASGATPPYTYTLSGSSAQALPVFENLLPGSYILTISDVNNCTETQNLTIGIAQPPIAQGLSSLIYCGQTIDIQPIISGGSADYVWNNGMANTPLTVSQPGQYSFLLVGLCQTTPIQFEVISGETDAKQSFFPNVFSPGANAVNDCYQPFFSDDITVLGVSWSIYDRWGTQIFQGQRLDDCWDGTFNGTMLQPAVFIWHATIIGTDCYGLPLVLYREGDVTLLR
jgi:gliding motility-associated-like protein